MQISNRAKQWLKCAGIRAVRTIAQTAVAAVGTATLSDQIDTAFILSTALLSGIISLFTSLAGLPECKEDADD